MIMRKKIYIVPRVETNYLLMQDVMKVSNASDREFGPESAAPARRTDVF